MKFESAGVHRLDFGEEVLNSGSRNINGVRSHESNNQQSSEPTISRPEETVQRHTQLSIAADNIGYNLLCKAGWTEGTGLGAQKQGRVTPIQAWHQKGNRGIGFSKSALQQQSLGFLSTEARRSEEDRISQARASQVQQSLGEKRRKLVSGIVQKELEGEDLVTKVKLHTQIMRQEQDEAERRAISRILSNALNDPHDMPYSSGDSNPLNRKHRLTALNPLLDNSP
ncbi:hypothetical protein CEUSTIGMA_g612.t1 [Chlamydomonas eustigma]|uniref:G-patch domain-containing protein n=1 Tax=Chlamydomonas eustigma TaxID=1157962 RepID=A0A250WR38_9CHLO|nr:hypothetical protein CEUSTIGMA_g612.t1 [Chlamydomonas eustigma]|eukprot:GAX73159.1 hypothetical protein CEUSTIGMA_g612.t1 [Chlamydomonas eustigma]